MPVPGNGLIDKILRSSGSLAVLLKLSLMQVYSFLDKMSFYIELYKHKPPDVISHEDGTLWRRQAPKLLYPLGKETALHLFLLKCFGGFSSFFTWLLTHLWLWLCFIYFFNLKDWVKQIYGYLREQWAKWCWMIGLIWYGGSIPTAVGLCSPVRLRCCFMLCQQQVRQAGRVKENK